MKLLKQLLAAATIICTLHVVICVNGSTSTGTTLTKSELSEDEDFEGRLLNEEDLWSLILKEWSISPIFRDEKVMKQKPYVITRPGDKPTRPTDTSTGATKEVTETDLYLLGAIEKLVYRVDFMEKRLRRTEELLYHLMASNKNEEEPCPTNFSRIGTYCYHFSERKLNWKSSASMCRALGSRLAELETVEENQDIVAYLQSTSPLTGNDFWTGGLNPGLLWIWSNSARPVASNSTTNPSNSTNIKGSGRCLKLAYSPAIRGYEYQGSECSVRANYICEYDENATSRALERIQKALKDKHLVEER